MKAIFADERYSVIEASTKSGKTVGSFVWLLACASAGTRGRNYWWIAPVYPQAEIAYRRLRDMLMRADRHKKSGWDSSEMRRTISLANGTTLWFKSGEKPDNLYGEDVYAAVMDEASRCRPEAWHALRSTITATRAPVRLIGNVRGRGWHYQMARKAEAGERDMAYFKLTADDAVEAGVLAQAEIEDARATLPHAIFRELYFCEPSDDGGNPFGLEAISRQIVDSIQPGPPVAWGFDLAKHANWTVGIALNQDGDVCGFQRWQTDWKNTMSRVGAMVGATPALIDSTGVGDPIVEELQRRAPCIEGYLFNRGSKQRLMEGLAVAIQQGEVRYPKEHIVAELEAFETEYTRVGVRYFSPDGMHDDCVDALALAVEAKRRFGSGVVMHIEDYSGHDHDGIPEGQWAWDDD